MQFSPSPSLRDEPLVAAVVQLNSTPDVAHNLGRVAELCERAARRGARLVVVPENFALMSSDESEKFRWAVTISTDGKSPHRNDSGTDVEILSAMQAVAKRLGIYLVLGGFPERAPPLPGPAGQAEAKPRVHNAAMMLGPDGGILSTYRKIHLFDVDFPGAATTLRESETVAAGENGQAVVAETPWGGVGLSVCYDVRFPELYRRLSAAGARHLVVPAAFTLHTGKDHWHVLLRARAIENQCFVFAAGQHGRHAGNRMTYGHSLICDPWGTVIAECSDGEGVAVAEIDLALQDKIRTELPSLKHRRLG